MLKSSEFNSAVPKFTNGNYASSPLDPTNIEEPSAQDYVRGTEPLDTLPAQWWNWLCNQFTSRFNKLNTYVKNIFDELTGFLSLLNITPDGTEGAITTGQLKNAFKESYPAYINDKLELGTTYVKKTQKVNNHALSGNITISKADVGLGSVANTGDSANASSGGTTKFTTGGAYNLLSSIAPYFSASTAYAVGALITYQNRLYECTIAHSAGAWNANHFTVRSVQSVISNYILPSLAPAFSTSTSYAVGAFVTYQNRLYRCKATHSAGAWNTSHFELANINNVSVDTDGKLALKADLLDLASAFSTSLNYAVGDYVTYNGNIYRCTVAHSAGTWDTSHFTVVTVGGELETKADKTSLALPTDAVLHYSFDDVPDYPDGTADVRLLDNNTFDIQSTDYRFRINNNDAIVNNDNGLVKITMTSRGSYGGVFINATYAYQKVIKLRIKVTDLSVGKLHIFYGSTDVIDITEIGIYEVSSYVATSNGLYFDGGGNASSCTFTVEKIYIGDGSYSTPIIDNANGQYNATNNGGIAVNGVSGKGVYLANGKYILTSNFNLSTDFSVSIWVKPDNSTSGLNGEIIRSIGQFVIRNGDTDNSVFGVIIWTSETLTYKSIGRLLSEGVWTHIVVTRSGTSMKLYLNGILTNTWTLNSENLQPATQSYSLGSSINTRPQSFDDLLIFDRALTENEVTALYLNKANTPKYYNINNYILDNTDTTPTQDSKNIVESGGVYTELAKKVNKTTTVNGHALSGNVTVTKGDVGLGNVANKDLSNVKNTGDSAVPAKNGITKFTTGGAFDFFGETTNSKTWLSRVFGWALGRNWTRTNDLTNLRDIFYLNKMWFVFSDTLNVCWSTDGRTWTQATGFNSNVTLNSMSYGNGIWIVCADEKRLYWSSDGKSWYLCTLSGTISSPTTGFCQVSYGNGIWVAASFYDGLWWSTNGKTWTQVTGSTSTYIFYSVKYADGIFVAGSGSYGLWWSTDGKNWTQSTDYTTASAKIFYANGIWFASDELNSVLYYSEDGKSWSNTNINDKIFCVCYAVNTWYFGGHNHCYSSFDGHTLTSISTMPNYISSIAYANTVMLMFSRNTGLYLSTDYMSAKKVINWENTRAGGVEYGDGVFCMSMLGRGIFVSDYSNANLQ